MLKDTKSIPPHARVYNWSLAGVIQCVLGGIALLWVGRVETNDWLTPGYFNVISGAFILFSIIQCIRKEGNQLLVDHLLILSIMFFVYYVFGALLIPFGPEEQVDRSLAYYRIDAQMAIRVAAVNCIGFGLALIAGSMVGRQYVTKVTRSAIGFGSAIPQYKIIAIFLLLGGSATFYVTLADFGENPEVVSGTLRTLSKLLLVAIMIASAYRGKYSRSFFVAAVLLTIFQSIAGLLLTNKSVVLYPIVALFLGLIWRFGGPRVIVPGLIIIIFIYLAIGTPVNEARQAVGTDGRVNWSERISRLEDGFFGGTRVDKVEEYGYWTRFSYIVPQGAAIDFYDKGHGGDDYTLLGWTFLPRLFFPEKPIITASGQEFHYKITGGMTSSTGQGVFVNGYYNLGWLGVIFVGVLVGCILAWTSAMAAEIFKARALLWIPIALMGSFMAFRIDGHFLADYWGTFGLLIYLVLGGIIMKKFFPRSSNT